MQDKILQIGNWTQNASRDNPQRGRVYDPRGIAPALTCMGGGNLQPFIIVRDGVKNGIAKENSGSALRKNGLCERDTKSV